MKKLLLLSGIAGFALFFSCKKSSPAGPSGSITAMVNGVQTSFNHVTYAKDSTNPNPNALLNAYALAISASTGNASSGSPVFGITITGPYAITKGTYYLDSVTVGVKTDPIYLSYIIGSGSTEYESNSYGANNCAVTITSISSTNVQGTFSGVLYLLNGNGPLIDTFTNGKFNVNF